MKFSGKSALVTGAGGGMGFEISNQLIQRGINVAMADVKAEPETIESGPGKHIYVNCDLTNETEINELVHKAALEWGGFEYFINTIGVLWIGKDIGAEQMDMEIWDRVFNINLRATVLLVKKVIPVLRKADAAAMVHFSSVDALSGDPAPQDAYGASKAALIRLSKSLAIQHAAENIRSNVILPGPALTPIQDRWKDNPDLQSQIADHIPIKRLGSAKDMANAALFLLSDNASYITGTELIVDGGLTALP